MKAINHTRPESPLSEHIGENIERIVSIQRKEWEERTASQRRVERVSRIIGRPIYLAGLIAFTGLWVAYNLLASREGWGIFDPFPFPVLDGILSLAALISTTVILIAQNRQSRLEQQHTHLALQVNLLTEQKVTKVIHLIEELRRDMPMVKDRHDPQSEALQAATDAEEVLLAIRDRGLMEEDREATAADCRETD